VGGWPVGWVGWWQWGEWWWRRRQRQVVGGGAHVRRWWRGVGPTIMLRLAWVAWLGSACVTWLALLGLCQGQAVDALACTAHLQRRAKVGGGVAALAAVTMAATNINQLKGAAEETMAAAMVTGSGNDCDSGNNGSTDNGGSDDSGCGDGDGNTDGGSGSINGNSDGGNCNSNGIR
jgi:hypothetical protein